MFDNSFQIEEWKDRLERDGYTKEEIDEIIYKILNKDKGENKCY